MLRRALAVEGVMPFRPQGPRSRLKMVGMKGGRRRRFEFAAARAHPFMIEKVPRIKW